MKKVLKSLIIFLILLCVYAGLIMYQKYRTENQQKNTPPVQTLTERSHVKIKSAQYDESNKIVVVTFEGGEQVKIARDDFWDNTTVSVVDINYDGIDDVMIEEPAGAYNMSTYFMVFNKDKNIFEEYPAFKTRLTQNDAFTGLGAVDFNVEEKKIESFYKGRGIGDWYTEETYYFIDGTWKRTKIETQDSLDFLNPNANEYYIRTIFTFNSEGATTSEKTEYLKQVEDQKTGNSTYIEVTKAELKKKGLIK